jgi:hypothetical protein
MYFCSPPTATGNQHILTEDYKNLEQDHTVCEIWDLCPRMTGTHDELNEDKTRTRITFKDPVRTAQ